MRNKLVICLGIFMMVALTACQKQIKGSGVKQTEARNVPIFNAIKVVGNYQVNVVVGNAQQVSVTSDNNVIPYILTNVEDKTLYVSTKSGVALTTGQSPIIDIAVQDLKAVEIVGVGSVTVANLKADKFNLKISGTGTANLSGVTNKVNAKISGTAELAANNLIAKEANLKLIGAGSATIYASQKLTVRVEGSGKVQYYGEPREVEQKISGNGEVIGIPNNAQKNPT